MNATRLVLIVFQDVEKWIFYYNKTMNRMEMKYAGVAQFTKITVITKKILSKFVTRSHMITCGFEQTQLDKF